MKKSNLLVAAMTLFAYCFGLSAQTESIYERGVTYDENTMPPSPEPASIVKCADIPFLHSSGMAGYDVPFYTLTGRELNIPIGLSYASGGIKLDEIAGVAGLGWTLKAGGCITRTVVDMPDEYSSAILHHEMPSGSLLNNLENNVDTTDTYNYLRDLLWHRIDGSLDRYSYNVGELSGSFVITDDGSVFQLSGDGVDISYTLAADKSVDIFTITGPDGTVYILSEKETATHLGRKAEEFTPTSGEPDRWSATTAWHMTQIRSRSGMEVAEFTYSDPIEWTSTVRSIGRTVNVTCGGSGNTPSVEPSSTYIYKSHDIKVLTLITLCGQAATFSYSSGTGSSVRQSEAQANFPLRLTKISVSEVGNPTELARLEVLTRKATYDGRIILDGLHLYRGSSLDDKWTFAYKEIDKTVSRGSQDWYGFYNGENEFTESGTSGICPYEYSSTSGLKLTNGYPNPEYNNYMSLISIDHDGAIVNFTYEGNAISYGNDTYYVGIRVKNIVMTDGMKPARVLYFTYESPYPSGPVVPTQEMYTTVTMTVRPSGLVEVCDWVYTFHDTPVVLGPSIRDTRIYYGKVTEDISNRLLITLGNSSTSRTIFEYSTVGVYPSIRYTINRFPAKWKSYYDSSTLAPSFCSPWNGVRTGYTDSGPFVPPVLTRREDYAYENDAHKLVSSIEYSYENTPSGSVLVSYYASQITNYYMLAARLEYDYIYHFPIYAGYSGKRPVKETHIDYHTSGNDTTVINTTYMLRRDLCTPERVSSVSIEEAGVTRMTQYQYSDSYDDNDGFATELKSQHCLSIPLTRTIRHIEMPSDHILNSTEVMKETTEYDYFSIGDSQYLLPSARVRNHLDTESWRKTILSRDCVGNISSCKENGRPETVILWSYNGRYPVAFIENASLSSVLQSIGGQENVDALTMAEIPSQSQTDAVSQLRENLPNAHVTTYTYMPGVGITSITDPAGLVTSFEYDYAGRLACVKDTDDNKVEEYKYDFMIDLDGRRHMRSRVFLSENEELYSEDVCWWDAFGRKSEYIALEASGDGRDLVTVYGSDFMMHDDVKSWLPYPVQGTEGTFQTGAESASATYHGNTSAYHSKEYEISSLSHVISTAMPGYHGTHETEYHVDVVENFPILMWDEDGVSSSGVYNPASLVMEIVTDADGRKARIYKDHSGRTLGTSYGSDAPTYHIYDRYDRLRAVIGSGIQFSDTLNMWRYGYDSLGRLASKGLPGSVREHYIYDAENRIVSIRKEGLVKEMEYDTFGRLLKVYHAATSGTKVLMEEHIYDTYPSGSWNGPSKGFETMSRLAELNSDGNVAGYTCAYYYYDNKKRLVKTLMEFSDGGNLTIDSSFTFAGETSSVTFTYSIGSRTDVLTLRYEYDVRGRKVAAMSNLYVGGLSVSSVDTRHSYDALGRLSSTVSSVNGGISLASTITYTLQGWISGRKVMVNGLDFFSEDLYYDGSPSRLSSTPLYTGMVSCSSTTWTYSGSSSMDVGYVYDHAGRLSREYASLNSGTDYIYDTRGNILSVSDDTGTTTFSYNGDRLCSLSGNISCSFTHDILGRMTSDGLANQTIDYNSLDLVRKISSASSTLANYSYLADGTKVSALDGSGDGLVYRGPFVYRTSGDGSSLTLESAACDEGRLTPFGTMFYVTDHLGSVRAVVDGETGDVYDRSNYSAFGARSSVCGPVTSPLPSGISLRDSYTGKEDQNQDFATDYIDFGVRQYNPSLRRWMTPDPLSEKYYGISPYAFCNNNPVRYEDVDGEDWIDKVVGYIVGGATNVVPGTGFIRDWYSPDNSSDYNSALKHTDEAAAALGIGMIGTGTGTMAAGGILATAGVGVTVSTAGVGVVVGGPAVAAGAEMAAVGAATAATGGVMVMNSSKNKSDGYERGKSNSNTHKTNKSGNQLQKAIEKGKAPKSIDRYDNGKGDYEKPHVHFKDGNALNQDGTWKHGGRDLTNKEKEFLKRYDWKTE